MNEYITFALFLSIFVLGSLGMMASVRQAKRIEELNAEIAKLESDRALFVSNLPPSTAGQDVQWTMRDGRKIWVSDMTDTHAKNTLRMLIKTRKSRAKIMDGLIQDTVDFIMDGSLGEDSW